jgi:hypothetical protein
MINALKTRIRESDRPVGTKRPNLIKLPPEGHVYGLEGRKDPEGVGTSKNILLFNFIKLIYKYSYPKLESASSL